jgi:hypothetical protein
MRRYRQRPLDCIPREFGLRLRRSATALKPTTKGQVERQQRVESGGLPLHLLLCCVFVVREGMEYYDEQGTEALNFFTAAVRRGLLSQGSHMAPSPQRCILCKRHETELTYCLIYGFKPSVFSTKGLT